MAQYGFIIPINTKGMEIILSQIKNSICNIYRKDGCTATGFFCEIPYKKQILHVLITNYHVINEEYIFKNKEIKISINDDRKFLNLRLDNNRRILYYNESFDITMIEILKEIDNIHSFLELDDLILENFDYVKNIYYKQSIYMLHYGKGKEAMVSYGSIKNYYEKEKLEELEIYHSCYSYNGSSGSPLLNIENNKVIGIHIGQNRNRNFRNIGKFLTYPIYELNNNKNIIRLFKNYKDEDFTNLKLISSGSFGEVYSAYNIEEEKEFCLKKINIEKMKLIYESNNLKDYQKDLVNEIKILEILSYNQNCVRYYGNYDKANEKIIIMEKCDNNLKEFIKQRGKGLNTKEIKEKFFELNELFKIIQEKKIIHRDLKLENFLIKYKNKEKTDYIIKLGDYGIGKFKREFSNSIYSGIKGTLETVAPEVLLEKNSSYENIVDIFSLGIILYQLANNLKHPYEENNFQLIIKYNNNYEKDNLEIKFDEEIKDDDFKDLIKKMIKLNPKNRLSWDSYFKHQYFK